MKFLFISFFCLMSHLIPVMSQSIDRLEKLKKSETKMDFYGKMLDQDGNTVPNVKVKY